MHFKPSASAKRAIGDLKRLTFDASTSNGLRVVNTSPPAEPSSGTVISSWISPLPSGKSKAVQAHLGSGRIIESQSGVVVAYYSTQASRDLLQEFAQVKIGHQGVVDFEEQPQAVAFTRKLLLINLGILKIQGIVDGHGNLRRHLSQELQVGFVVRPFLDRPEDQGAHAPLGGGEWQQAERFYAFLA